MRTQTRLGITIPIVCAAFVCFTTRPASANTYRIPIEVSVPASVTADTEATKAYNKLVLGVQAGATENYDPQWDTPAFFTTPNENPPLLKAVIEHPEYAGNQRELWRDIRPDTGGGAQTWNLSVSLAPSEIGKTVTLAWALPPSLASSGKRVTLNDSESNTAVDMRSQSTYQFVYRASSPKALSVTIASGSSDHGSSGPFGCGVIRHLNPGPPTAGTTAAVLINVLILFTPILVRLRRPRPAWAKSAQEG